jgi:hypothetical protein
VLPAPLHNLHHVRLVCVAACGDVPPASAPLRPALQLRTGLGAVISWPPTRLPLRLLGGRFRLLIVRTQEVALCADGPLRWPLSAPVQRSHTLQLQLLGEDIRELICCDESSVHQLP